MMAEALPFWSTVSNGASTTTSDVSAASAALERRTSAEHQASRKPRPREHALRATMALSSLSNSDDRPIPFPW